MEIGDGQDPEAREQSTTVNVFLLRFNTVSGAFLHSGAVGSKEYWAWLSGEKFRCAGEGRGGRADFPASPPPARVPLA